MKHSETIAAATARYPPGCTGPTGAAPGEPTWDNHQGAVTRE